MTGYLSSTPAGSTQFYPTLPADHFVGERAVTNVPSGQSILISAMSFAAISRGQLIVPEIPEHIPEVAVDPGGFVAHIKGGYTFRWDQFIEWCHAIGPKLSWAAFPDLPVEPELASDALAVRARQEKTLQYAHDLWVSPTCGENDGYRGQPWSWVATVQGRQIDEYVWMAEQLAPLLSHQQFHYDYMGLILGKLAGSVLGNLGSVIADEEMLACQTWATRCANHRRVAIGSLCKRKDLVEACKIVSAVAEILPNERFHLWGISTNLLPLLQRAGLIDRIASFDTSAYNGRFATGIKRVDAERKRMKLSQRAHADKVLLPRYSQRVADRLSQTTLGI